MAEKSLKDDPKPIQFLGDLVHNEKVIQRFRKKGVKFISQPTEAEPGTLIIQAHGFPPFSEKIKKRLLIRDATCPLVKKVQQLANFLCKKDYKIIIFGDKNHPETKGIQGYVQNQVIIIGNENQAKKLPKFKKIGLVSQTTQSLDKFNGVLKVLKNKTGKLKWFNTLCPEVMKRQKELDEILEKSDGILVIGSRSSANTKKLAEKAKKFQKQVWRLNSLKELKSKKKELKKIMILGVVSGASAPDWEIEKIKKWLNNLT